MPGHFASPCIFLLMFLLRLHTSNLGVSLQTLKMKSVKPDKQMAVLSQQGEKQRYKMKFNKMGICQRLNLRRKQFS